MDYENKPKIRLTPKQALIRAEKYCVYQDRCQYEVKNKLYEWGIYGNDIDDILAALISDDFINEKIDEILEYA